MRKYINKILRESINKFIFEDKDIEDGLISILKSGESSDVELAYLIGGSQGIDMDELVKSIIPTLIWSVSPLKVIVLTPVSKSIPKKLPENKKNLIEKINNRMTSPTYLNYNEGNLVLPLN